MPTSTESPIPEPAELPDAALPAGIPLPAGVPLPAGIPEPADPAGRLDPDEPPLRAVVEAVLLVAEEPVPLSDLAAGLERTLPEVEAAVVGLSAEYDEAGRGFALRETGGGWRFYTAERCAPYVERFVVAGQSSRLSQAALETLAIVAYQQPVTRGRVSAIRGVSVDGVLRTLVTRRLVEEAGTDPDTSAIRYRTTGYFLQRLGLRDLSELPPLAPLLPGLDDLPPEKASG